MSGDRKKEKHNSYVIFFDNGFVSTLMYGTLPSP